VAASEGLVGCAQLLEWSEARHGRVVARDFGTGKPPALEPTASVNATNSAEATSSPAHAWPDLAVTRGDDPARNTATAVAMLGGMSRFVKRGQSVVVKPNILSAREPQFGVTTNPQAVATVVRLAWEAGAKSVTVLDRPTAPALPAYTVSGIQSAVQSVDGTMKVLSARDFERIAIPQGRAIHDWPMVADVFDADVVINMPCAKTHGLAGLTLAMKNLMGILGDSRGAIHQDFATKITDLATLVKPQLIVLDAYRLLVRNGPSGGSLSDVRPGRTCVAGTNMVSVDAYGATLFGRAPRSVPYIDLAAIRGLGVADLDRLRIEKRSV